jgi:hypothetical protein
MQALIVSALLGMLSKVLTASFVEFVIVKCAEILVSKTNTPHDDEFLAKIKELLAK